MILGEDPKPLLKNYGLERMQEAIGRYELPAAAFHYARVEGPVPLGSSKFAGEADLAEGTSWPYDDKGRPLAFLCQVNFAEVQQAQPIDELPDEGLAVFFYELDTDNNWYDFFQKSGLRCMYFPSGTTLVQTVPPAVPEEMHECTLHFWPYRTHPDVGSEPFDKIKAETGMTDDEWDRYNDWIFEHRLSQFPDGDGTIHQVWGNPATIQGDLCFDAELSSSGLTHKDVREGDQELLAKLDRGSSDWQLLLQVDSDQLGSDSNWGDLGRLYYLIRRQDLAQLDFSRVWHALECG